jgi:glycosyltransferase involved in cell wall biosynthesis
MRILHLDSGREMRGGQHQVLLLLHGLQARGHEQTLLARAPLLDRWQGEMISSTKIVQAARGVDLVHAHDARSHTLAALLCAGKPLVVSRRVAFPVKQSFLSRQKYVRADRYLAVSEFVSMRLRDAGVPPAKIQVVYDGVVLPAGNVRQAAPTKSTNSPLKIVTPRLDDPLKHGALAQQACDAAGASLVFSGDLTADLPAADAFLYLSESEGLGSAILLAMANRVPVIASRVGGILEIVEHEVTGLLVQNEMQAVADAIRRLNADPESARQWAERAYHKVSTGFTDDIMVRQTEHAYHTVLGLKPSP